MVCRITDEQIKLLGTTIADRLKEIEREEKRAEETRQHEWDIKLREYAREDMRKKLIANGYSKELVSKLGNTELMQMACDFELKKIAYEGSNN